MFQSRVCAWLVLFFVAHSMAMARDYFVFAPLPMENREAVIAKAVPFVQFLEKELRKPVRIQYHENYADIIRGFNDGSVDFAYLGPLPYLVLAAENSDVAPVVFFRESSGSVSYTCSLVTPFDTEYTLQDLASAADVPIKLTQPLSTCGTLAAKWMLHQKGVDIAKMRIDYLGSHEAVALEVTRHPNTLGSLKTSIGQRYTHLGLQELAQTPPLPAFALVVNLTKLTALQLAHLKNALLNIPESLSHSWPLGKYGFAPIDTTSYDVLLQMIEDLGAHPSHFRQYLQ